MAVAVLSKKKLKNRSSQRSPSSRALEEVDEDAAIISFLENEPWQPDLLLERRSDRSTSDLGSFQSTAVTNNISKNAHYRNGHSNEDVNTGTGQKASGFQGVIPVIIKSPSSITSGVTDTITESDYADSIADVDNDQPIVVSPAKIRGIEEYLQQTHQERQLLQQQQQEIQMQLQMQKERDRERGKGRENVREKARTGGKERGTETPPMKLQLQYQLPAHLQITSVSDQPDYRRQQTIYAPHIQQHCNSYHGPVQPSSKELFSGLEERTSPLAPAHTLTSRSKTSESAMDVVESLQSLKHITMLALDGLLQQVVSDVTASDPIHNADETTLQARALIRRRSIPLLDLAGNEPEELTFTTLTGTTAAAESNKHSISLRNLPSTRKSISDTPIASMASSSLERLDELARKVDQLAAAAADEQQNQQQIQGLNGMLPSSPSGNEGHVLHEPLEIPVRRQDQLFAQGQQLDLSQVFESEEYQLACALAAMLACIYRILDHMQQPRYNEREQSHLAERPRHPQRTESVDSGLDQASKLWKRLESNSSARNPLRPSASLPVYAATNVSASKMIMGSHISSSPERKVFAGHEISPRSSSPAANGTGGFMQTINKQVRTLRSRRSQSTSHIEVGTNRHSTKSMHVRLLNGFQVGSNSKTTTSADNHGSFYTEAGLRLEEAKELELEWSELDKLMDEMTRLWRSVENSEQQQQSSEEEPGLSAKVDTDEDNENNPFHDRHRVRSHQQEQQQQQQQQQRQQGLQSAVSPLKMGPPYAMSPTQGKNFDEQTLEMSTEDDLPQYDDAPEYMLNEKPTDRLLPSRNVRSRLTSSLISRTSRGVRSLTGNHSRTGGVVDDEKTRFDLNNVMSAIERLSKVAPRLDDQRVQLSPNQRKHKTRASFAHTIERLSRDRWDFQFGSSSASASSSSNKAATKKREAKDKHRDLDKLINQIVECANKTSSSSYTTAQRAEFSPKQQWKLECARERGEKMRMSDQDWHSPEKVLLQDMTRLTNTLYQQSASSRAFATQRYTLTEEKARNMALQGIISKIERVSSRRMGNQDAASSSMRSKSASPSSTRTACRESSSGSSSERVKELQEMINQVMESGGGPTRKSAMASQRAEFSPKN
ncbi:hypothetical protein BGX34_006024 [Mortierella sp. NVP85]|nr:hypothetical protein BGX34_006024 [Mortierella sp. NVP85]